jgi:hypothetical protein
MNKAMTITREELYERIWKLPATKLAGELGISDVALTKICRKLNVPKPGPGHWRLVQLGWEMERPALLALAGGAAAEALVDPEPHRRRKDDSGGSADDGKPKYEVIPVPGTLHGAHPIISGVRRTLEAVKPGKRGFVEVPYGSRVLHVDVSRAQMSRALRIMDALVKALERRGAAFVKTEEKSSEFMELRIDGERVGFELMELLAKKEDGTRMRWWEREYCALTGRLQFKIYASEPKGARRCWTDCTHYQLQEKVGEIVHWMFITAEAEKRARLAREERWRQAQEELKRMEEERRRKEEVRKAEERRRQMEEICRSHLEDNSEAWFKARRLRRFIRACEAAFRKEGVSLPAGDWRQAWLAWAREHADRLDPMTNGFLEGEHERLTAPKDEEADPEPAERSVGDIMQEMMFGKGWPEVA